MAHPVLITYQVVFVLIASSCYLDSVCRIAMSGEIINNCADIDNMKGPINTMGRLLVVIVAGQINCCHLKHKSIQLFISC